jgi:hypothetical protein
MANEPRTFVCGWGKRLPGFPTAVPNGVVCVALRGSVFVFAEETVLVRHTVRLHAMQPVHQVRYTALLDACMRANNLPQGGYNYCVFASTAEGGMFASYLSGALVPVTTGAQNVRTKRKRKNSGTD